MRAVADADCGFGDEIIVVVVVWEPHSVGILLRGVGGLGMVWYDIVACVSVVGGCGSGKTRVVDSRYVDCAVAGLVVEVASGSRQIEQSRGVSKITSSSPLAINSSLEGYGGGLPAV